SQFWVLMPSRSEPTATTASAWSHRAPVWGRWGGRPTPGGGSPATPRPGEGGKNGAAGGSASAAAGAGAPPGPPPGPPTGARAAGAGGAGRGRGGAGGGAGAAGARSGVASAASRSVGPST